MFCLATFGAEALALISSETINPKIMRPIPLM